MASCTKEEWFMHCTIDCSDMTVTEFLEDSVKTYSITDILRRWSGLPGVTIHLSREEDIPESGRC